MIVVSVIALGISFFSHLNWKCTIYTVSLYRVSSILSFLFCGYFFEHSAFCDFPPKDFLMPMWFLVPDRRRTLRTRSVASKSILIKPMPRIRCRCLFVIFGFTHFFSRISLQKNVWVLEDLAVFRNSLASNKFHKILNFFGHSRLPAVPCRVLILVCLERPGPLHYWRFTRFANQFCQQIQLFQFKKKKTPKTERSVEHSGNPMDGPTPTGVAPDGPGVADRVERRGDPGPRHSRGAARVAGPHRPRPCAPAIAI